jgi:hypothetical protein
MDKSLGRGRPSQVPVLKSVGVSVDGQPYVEVDYQAISAPQHLSQLNSIMRARHYVLPVDINQLNNRIKEWPVNEAEGTERPCHTWRLAWFPPG